MGIVISAFCHKGGVGKTSFIYNLGYALADLGKKVLFIDADTQINLTSYVFGKSDTVNYGKATKGNAFDRLEKQQGVIDSDWEVFFAEHRSFSDSRLH